MVTESKPRPLTPLQARFVAEYQVDENATQAAIRAGANPNSAHVTAHKWLQLAKVQQALANTHSRALERAQVATATEAGIAEAAWIIRESVRLYERCIQDEPVRDKHGETTGQYVFDSNGANRALDRLSKRLPEWKDASIVDNSQHLHLPDGTTLADLKALRDGLR